jgi:hypothetical protein
MKDSVVAQQIVQELLVRQEMKGMFDRDELCAAILAFLRDGVDPEDRAACARLALGRADRRTGIPDIIAEAQRILDWPPKPKSAPVAKKTTRKKLRRR